MSLPISSSYSVSTIGSSFVSEIEKRQDLLKSALATKSRYPIMNRGDKNSYEHFVIMQEAFQSQNKQAQISKTLGDHLLRIYDTFLEKLHTLYMKLTEYNFDPLSANGLYNDCPSLEWCKQVQVLIQDCNEFPFHQLFLNKTLFAHPQYKYDYNQITEHLNNASADETRIAADNNTFFTTHSLPNRFPENTFNSSLTFNAYGSSISSGTTPEPALVQPTNLSHKAMRCRNVLNILTEEWSISNKDNSLPGVLLEHFSTSDDPYAFVWKLLDPSYFCEALSESMDPTSALVQTFSPDASSNNGANAQYLVDFMGLIYQWIQGVEQNRLVVESQVIIINSILESSKLNLEIAESQIQMLSNVNDEQLLAMIESGNSIKKQLDKLPVTSAQNIFTPSEYKKITSLYF